jgi:radical SAM superfamily enzyme YgiQ (UPF0313 family)
MKVDLVSVPANYGSGANDGAYYPVGLLTLGTHLRQTVPELEVSIIDMHHEPDYHPKADIVGISASTTLNYKNVLSVAQKAKNSGATVVLGGPHATQLADQILRNRTGLIDYIIRGNGEIAFGSFLKALQTESNLGNVPNLSWRSPTGDIIHNPLFSGSWNYDDFLPLDMSLLRHGVIPYWEVFKNRIDANADAALVMFTHFGCGYREMKRRSTKNKCTLSQWCSYCSLNEHLSVRAGDAIVNETINLLETLKIPEGSNVLLKCYGDNVGTQKDMLKELAIAIEHSEKWHRYRICWTFYAQSCRISKELCELLQRVGTKNLYIGFDSVDDAVQKINGLGTSIKSHRRAVSLCQDYNIKIQAGFVLGCAGETEQSLENTLRFGEELASKNVLERIAAGILFIIPGSPAYSLLCEKEPWIKALDDLPTKEVQLQWLRYFCPSLGSNPSDGFNILHHIANRLDDLSPGPHASMGFMSNRLTATLTSIKEI